MRIGKLEQVQNLREIWDTEPRFSDWLVSDEGREVIERDLGIQIENAQREVRGSDYPCDVVGNLVGEENHIVIIENQFGRTNHDHLGKLMTYAAVNRSTTAVWIAEQASDDHRSVIDWLNENTPPHLSFFLTQIRAFRIGESPIAPQLEVICRPNVEAKIKTEASSELKERHLWRKKFWTEIHDYIEAQKPPFRLQSPGFDHWSVVTLGRSGFHLGMLLNTQRKCLTIEFVAAPVGWRDVAYEQLKEREERIANQISKPLQWECKADTKRARIFTEAAINPRDEANREAVKEWFYHTICEFHACFSQIVRELEGPRGRF